MPLQWCLLVVGRNDGIQDQLQRRVDDLGLTKRVHFLGSRRDIPALLAAADIGLLVSHQEGFSNAILEGMAAGLPMIVTDVGGNAEAVQDGKTGLVVPARDPDRLAAAIVKLSNDPAARAAFGRSGQHRVRDCFSFEACIDSYERLYTGLLRGEFRGGSKALRSSKPFGQVLQRSRRSGPKAEDRKIVMHVSDLYFERYCDSMLASGFWNVILKECHRTSIHY
jgi:hypothetical protein